MVVPIMAAFPAAIKTAIAAKSAGAGASAGAAGFDKLSGVALDKKKKKKKKPAESESDSSAGVGNIDDPFAAAPAKGQPVHIKNRVKRIFGQ